MGNTCSNGGVSIVMLVFGGVIFQGVFHDLYLEQFSTDWLMFFVVFRRVPCKFPKLPRLRGSWNMTPKKPKLRVVVFLFSQKFPEKKIGTQIYFAWSFFHVTKNSWHFPWPLIYDFLFRFTRFIFPKNEHPIRHWVSHGCLGIPDPRMSGRKHAKMYEIKYTIQPMVIGGFGARWFGFLGSPKNERDCYLGVPQNPKPPGPQTNNVPCVDHNQLNKLFWVNYTLY